MQLSVATKQLHLQLNSFGRRGRKKKKYIYIYIYIYKRTGDPGSWMLVVDAGGSMLIGELLGNRPEYARAPGG